jgi:hypothetical protein
VCSNPVAAGANCPAGSPPCSLWYPDCDSDGSGAEAGVPISSCDAPTAKPSCASGTGGYANNNQDCCDLDTQAHPGQTQYFTVLDGCGTFDYNCDGADGPQSNGPTDCLPANPECILNADSSCSSPPLPPDCVDGMEDFEQAACGQTRELHVEGCAPVAGTDGRRGPTG